MSLEAFLMYIIMYEYRVVKGYFRKQPLLNKDNHQKQLLVKKTIIKNSNNNNNNNNNNR